MTQQDILSNCKAGNHNLKEISRSLYDAIGEVEAVVRWCTICGSITVDEDYDGRTAPGRIMKMRSPRISQQP